MIKASLIYVAVTILLAFVDSVRIKRAKGIVENINHGVSSVLAGIGVGIVCAIFIVGPISKNHTWIEMLLYIVALLAIRGIVYDGALNLWRRFKIDYESPTTSSYVDQHTNKLTFWDKRFIAVGAWFVCWLLYYLIFEKK